MNIIRINDIDMIEIHKYDIKNGKKTCEIYDDYFTKDGDVDFKFRYIKSLNDYSRQYYYYYVPIYHSVD